MLVEQPHDHGGRAIRIAVIAAAPGPVAAVISPSTTTRVRPPRRSPEQDGAAVPAAEPAADAFLAKPHRRLTPQPSFPHRRALQEPGPDLLRHHVLYTDDVQPLRFPVSRPMSSEIDGHRQKVGELACPEPGSINDINPYLQRAMPNLGRRAGRRPGPRAVVAWRSSAGCQLRPKEPKELFAHRRKFAGNPRQHLDRSHIQDLAANRNRSQRPGANPIFGG